MYLVDRIRFWLWLRGRASKKAAERAIFRRNILGARLQHDWPRTSTSCTSRTVCKQQLMITLSFEMRQQGEEW